MAWQPFATSRKSKEWRDSENPDKFVVEATIAPIHYESELDSGVADTPVDFSINKVDNAQLDGWIVQADYHYALGIDKLNHPGEDGWFAFGGRQGAHWLKFRLERVGYLRYANLTWTGIGGLPTYTRAGNLSQTTGQVELLDGAETINIGFEAQWRNLWNTPNGGEAWLEFKADGARLKVNPTFDQLALDYLRTQYPGTGAQTNQYYLSYVFRLDHADIPRTYKQNVLQDLSGDFDDDNGLSNIEFRDDDTSQNPLGNLLGLLPLDDLIVRDATAGDELGRLRLRKRIYQDGGNTFLVVGVRVDLLNSLLSQFTQDVIVQFDPTVDAQVGASADDAREASNTVVSLTVSPYTSNSDGERVAARWSVAVPNGATVDVSYIQWYATDSLDFAHRISVEDVDSAAAYQANNGDISGRTYESNTVAWSGTATNDAFNTSPSLNAPLQNVFARAGWASGNYIGTDTNHDSSIGTGNIRFNMYDGGAAIAPKIHIEYTAAGGGGVTVNLSTLSLASSTPSLSVSPGAISTALNTLSLTSSAVSLSVTSIVTVALNSITLAGSAVSLSVSPGAASVSLNSLSLASSAETLTVIPGTISTALNTLTLTGSVEALTVTSAATVTLNSLNLASSAVSLSVTPGAISVSLSSLSLVSSAESLTVTAGAVTVLLNTLSLAGSAVALSVSPGGVTITLNDLTLISSAVSLSVSAGTIVGLNSLSLMSSAVSLSVSPGAVSVSLSALTLASSAETLSILTGVLVALNSLTLTGSAVSLSVSPGAITASLNTLTLVSSAEALSVIPGAITASLNTLSLVSSAEALTVSLETLVLLNTLSLVSSAPSLAVAPGAASISLSSLSLTSQVIALTVLAASTDALIRVSASDDLAFNLSTIDEPAFNLTIIDERD